MIARLAGDGEMRQRSPPGRTISPAGQVRRLYRGLSGYGTGRDGPGGTLLRKAPCSVYGELTAVGVQQLIRVARIVPEDRFVDLGSGIGKVVLHVALAVEGTSCLGLEIDGDRHRIACGVLERAEAQGVVAPGRCALLHADMLTADLQGATMLFANSTCFGQQLLVRLAERIAGLPGPLAFATLLPLPRRAAARFSAASSARCQTSWSRDIVVHVYRLE